MATTILNRLNSLQDNPTFQKTPVSEKFYTTKLLNWVESIEIGGKLKTVFYSELNNNFNIGDRVYILNGNYDTDEFIKINKYSKFSDGYRVLGRDGTRIILDLDYTGVLPYDDSSKENFIKVQNVRTQREFDYINSIKIACGPLSVLDELGNTIQIATSPNIYSKFGGELRALGTNPLSSTVLLYTNSIIFAESNFAGSSEFYNLNSGVGTRGFYVKNGTNWINITSLFVRGSIKNVIGNYSQSNDIYITGEDIDYQDYYFRQRNVYKYEYPNWIIDIKKKQPYISKLSFRKGKFTGKHNDGIFGTSLNRNTWNSAEWNSGAFLNSEWISGSMNSKSTNAEKSSYSVLTSTSSRPTETIDFTNNKGFGYNLIEDSNFVNGNLLNGNFTNCNIGFPLTFSATELYFNNSLPEMKINGKFELCNIYSVNSEFSTIINSSIDNSIIENSTIINSQLSKTVANASTISDKNSIKILSADLWSYAIDLTVIGVIKLFISDSDLSKLNLGESFYLYRIGKEYFLNDLSDDQKVLLPIETKYLLDLYFDSEIGDKISVSIKNKDDNKFQTFAYSTNPPPSRPVFETRFDQNSSLHSSIDIESERFGIYLQTIINTPDQIIKMPGYILNPIDRTNINQFFKGSEISNSDFKSGYFNNSTWLNSANINYNHLRIKKDGQNLEISAYTSDILNVLVKLNPYNATLVINEEDISVNDIIWLNSITQIENTTGVKKEIKGRFKVLSVTDLTSSSEREFRILAQEGQTFSLNSQFRVEGAEFSNYLSVNKFRIENSTINKGFFKRTSITNSNFINPDFNNQDRDLSQSNIKQLKIVNIIFKDTNNTLNAGLIYKSHFVNDRWKTALSFNSIWKGGTFEGGIFNNSYWQNGTFQAGSFINSRELLQTTQDYNDEPVFKNWQQGTFNSGEFWNSYWMSGTFNNGKFYNSEWFSGVWNNGILGSNNLSHTETKMGTSFDTQSTFWYNGVVENALIGGEGKVNWYGGKFLNGELTDNSSVSSSTQWFDGDFLGGKITGYVVWKNGNFYKGKFLSILGWDSHTPRNPILLPNRWGWENGKFFDGEFGNGSTGANSVWRNGEFRGGIFMGRYWNYGLFLKGRFLGSLDSSIYNSPISPFFERTAIQNFGTSNSPYFGFWRDGIVSDKQEKIVDLISTGIEVKRKSEIRKEDNRVFFSKVLWQNGTFSHKNAIIQSSIWINGNFYDGTFDSGVFNPFFDRVTFNADSRTAEFSTQSVWHNGKFTSTLGTASFYFSEWKKGVFEKGYMSGAIWKDGIWNYGTADNIFWETGLWRNGNWNGSPFNYADLRDFRAPTNAGYEVTGRAKELILNVSKSLYSDNLHLNNAVITTVSSEVLPETEINFFGPLSSTSSFSQYTFDIDQSNWQLAQTFNTNSSTTINKSNIYSYGGTPQPTTFNNFGYNWTNPSGLYNIPTSNMVVAKDVPNSRFVFTSQNSTYEIRIRISVELAPTVTVQFDLGENNPIIIDFSSNSEIIVGSPSLYNYWAKQYDVTLVYVTPDRVLLDEEKYFGVKKIGTGLLRIFGASIKQKNSQYETNYNNTIVWAAISGNNVFLPRDISPLGSSDAGGIISINFGNGLFKSGIWENGIWNDGFRSNRLFNTTGASYPEPDYYRFSDVIGFNGIRPFGGKNSYQVDGNNWLVTLKGLDPVIRLNVGDKISIGNIVVIDVNEKRRLIKDFYKISEVDVQNNSITINIYSDFPVRRIEKDSSDHLIYVSKNIWLSGAFLNGYFRGIWNDGLFKGFPNITIMEDTQWIDGKFDGGRFSSLERNEISTNTLYNTGLIQKFIFNDNYLGLTNQKKYLSWIDINYKKFNYTQLNETITNFVSDDLVDTQSLYITPLNISLGIEYFKNQLFKEGVITHDVLESISTFSENLTLKKRKFNLGTKFKKYENFIPEEGNFTKPFSNALGNSVNLDNFFNDDWTYSELLSGVTFSQQQGSAPLTWIFPSTPLRLSSNTNTFDSNKLRIYNRDNTSPNVIINNHNGTDLNHIRISGLRLNNLNFTPETNRYYISEIKGLSYSFFPPNYPQHPYSGSTIGNLVIQTYSISLEIKSDVNELLNPNSVKTQYFYNKVDLSILIKNSSYAQYANASPMTTAFLQPPSPSEAGKFSFTFDNISIYEVDMIPFFKYFEESEIDQRVKSPNIAIAPFIDYSNANFDFLGNVRLTIDSDEIIGQSVLTTINGIGGGNGSFVEVDLNAVPIRGNVGFLNP